MDLNLQQKPLQNLLAEGRMLIKKQQFQQAGNICQYITNTYADEPEAWFLASQFAFTVNNPPQAISFIDKSLAIDSKLPKYLLLKAQCLIKLNRINNAKTIISELLEYKGSDHGFITNLAKSLVDIGLFKDALRFYELAIELKPEFSGYHYNLASTLRMLGDIDGAERALAKVITLDPEDHEAIQMRSSLKKQSSELNNVAHLQSVLDKGIDNPLNKAHILYALAKESEDLGEYSESFQYLAKGAEARRKLNRYQVDIDINAMKQIIQACPQELFQAERAQNNTQGDNAIFILGLPRTGSTLLERIISSHSKVYAAGELDNFSNITLSTLSNIARSKRLPPQDMLSATADLDFMKLGQDYCNSVKEWCGDSDKFIDKRPLNSQFIGYIHLALPAAKIIHVQRHPLDTCYAMYKNLFANAYPFSYSLEEIAKFYIAHHHLMQHWYKVIPHAIHTIKYEDIISDFENKAIEVIDHCGLEWQENCLSFHKNKLASTTASASQVREGLYSSSVGSWKNYEKQLQPLKKYLEDAGIAL